MDVQGAVSAPRGTLSKVCEQQTSQHPVLLEDTANEHFSGRFLPRAVTPFLQVVTTEKGTTTTKIMPLAL